MRVLCLLSWVVAIASPIAYAVEFEDYDFSRFSQEVTECDRLASHGRDPGHVAPAVSSSGMDKPAAIAACQQAVAADPDNPGSTISSVGRMAIRVGVRRRCRTD